MREKESSPLPPLPTSISRIPSSARELGQRLLRDSLEEALLIICLLGTDRSLVQDDELLESSERIQDGTLSLDFERVAGERHESREVFEGSDEGRLVAPLVPREVRDGSSMRFEEEGGVAASSRAGDEVEASKGGEVVVGEEREEDGVVGRVISAVLEVDGVEMREIQARDEGGGRDGVDSLDFDSKGVKVGSDEGEERADGEEVLLRDLQPIERGQVWSWIEEMESREEGAVARRYGSRGSVVAKHGEMGEKEREPEVRSSVRRAVVEVRLIHRGGELPDQTSDRSWLFILGSVCFDESDEGGEVLEGSEVDELVEMREREDLFSSPNKKHPQSIRVHTLSYVKIYPMVRF